MTSPISAELRSWTSQAAAIDVDADRAAQLIADADRAELEAMRKRQAANRSAAYRRGLPSRYAAATYATLRSYQDPQQLVSSWLQRGPRALILAGHPRVGKTTSAYAIANDAHAADVWVVATPVAVLSAALKPHGDPGAYARAVGCDLLVLDDLGREKLSDWWLEQLQLIVDERCSHMRRLVVTTNSAPDPEAAYETLADRYGEPIAERLIDGGGIVAIDGPAVRELVTSW